MKVCCCGGLNCPRYAHSRCKWWHTVLLKEKSNIYWKSGSSEWSVEAWIVINVQKRLEFELSNPLPRSTYNSTMNNSFENSVVWFQKRSTEVAPDQPCQTSYHEAEDVANIDDLNIFMSRFCCILPKILPIWGEQFQSSSNQCIRMHCRCPAGSHRRIMENYGECGCVSSRSLRLLAIQIMNTNDLMSSSGFWANVGTYW